MPAHVESEFSFDLDHIEQVTSRARGWLRPAEWCTSRDLINGTGVS
ncbi:Uncharacterised protein [Mycobacteroides abscessus subsp. abscessus]|nr:Uncharacterised protein [Mycobacteroides abscessus subsp. abscessus]SKP63653.1 Uncharacterised protein [Mycobacteroides abscessus subsp. abscessus]